MANSNYFIRNDYRENQAKAASQDEVYWNKDRISSSLYYQFPVYKYAEGLIIRHGCISVLDVGCGVGTKLAMLNRSLPGVDFRGVDRKEAIDYCRRTYSFGSWQEIDLERPEDIFRGSKFDLVICADVIEHLVNPDNLMHFLKKSAAIDGFIILSTPERDLLRGSGCNCSPNPCHVREWNADELKQYLAHHGFSVIDHFLQLPIRCGFSKVFFAEIIKRILLGKKIKYNQVLVLRPG